MNLHDPDPTPRELENLISLATGQAIGLRLAAFVPLDLHPRLWPSIRGRRPHRWPAVAPHPLFDPEPTHE